MTRLQSELHRLYQASPAGPDAAPGQLTLIDAHGLVRALVLELARPADWEELAALWRAVQDELDLPAPAIAVSGSDALQLWFSLAEAVSVSEAQRFLQCLRARYLPEVAGQRLRLWPAVDSAGQSARHARSVPAAQPQTGYWSAFVTADLAPVFADTPWIDSEPSKEGQAGLLSRLRSISPAAFAASLQQLRGPSPEPNAEVPATAAGVKEALIDQSAPALAQSDPRRFLLQIMNDERVALALRIEAAKALLPYS